MTAPGGLSREVARISRALGLFVATALALQLAALIWRLRAHPPVIDDKLRSLLWVTALAPGFAVAFVVGLVSAKRRRELPVLPTVVTVAALILPGTVAVFFFDIPASFQVVRDKLMGIYALALIAFLWRNFVRGSSVRASGYLAETIDFAADVLWHEWRREAVETAPSPTAFDVPQAEMMARLSARAYSSTPALQAFQATFSGVVGDGAVIAEVAIDAQPDILSASELRVLDIGGGEGEVTAGVLAAFRQHGYSKNVTVYSVEPADVESAYVSKLAAVNARVIPAATDLQSFAAAKLPAACQLVLASHSLYAPIDDRGFENHNIVSAIANNITDEGVALILLSSAHSQYWKLRYALRASLFPGERIVDTCWENVTALQALEVRRGGLYLEREIVMDNVIELPRRDDELQMRRWLAYALRKDADKIDGQQIKDASEILDDLSLRGNTLPECFIAGLAERRILASAMERVVLHKAILGVYRVDTDVRRPSASWRAADVRRHTPSTHSSSGN
jgi:hypothetical protein